MGTRVWGAVREELRRMVLVVPGVSGYQLEFMVRRLDEEPLVPWLADAIEKGNARTATLGYAGMVEERGIYKLDLHWPTNGLEADGEDLADAIRLAFRHGRGFEAAGPDVIQGWIFASHARGAIPLATKTVFPIRIDFAFRRATTQGWA